MKILLFGGSFDPVHKGHVSIVNKVVNHLKIDKIFIIPTKVSHWKALDTTSNDRFNMLKLAYEGIENIHFSTYELEKDIDEPSYSIDTINHYQELYPNDEIFFLIGNDQYKLFNQWKDWELILSKVTLLVYSRNEVSQKIIKDPKIVFLPFDQIDISSTDIKNDLVNNDNLDKKVYQYIIDHALYSRFWLTKYISKKRYEHSLRVGSLIKQALKLNGYADLKSIGYTIGVYHDIAKEFDDEKLYKYLKNDSLKSFPKPVLHGVSGANFLKEVIGYNNELGLNAISRHTMPFEFGTGPLTILDKVLFCCDKLEYNRSEEDINNIDYFRQLLLKDIDECFTQLYKALKEQYNN
ncbi:MAG: nicotinate (nicotinamide) nucleotide adenylyltransferase [Mycoplasma sp.]